MKVALEHFVGRVMINVHVGDDPDRLTKRQPSSAEGVIFAVPEAAMRAVIEQVNAGIKIWPVNQIGVLGHEPVDGRRGDLQEARGNAMGR